MQKILRRLTAPDQYAIRQLLKVYRDADRETLRFARLTKLRCPSGCGACCHSTKVEASLFEMLPLALMLWSKGQGLTTLQKLKKRARRKKCLFFKASPRNARSGRCQIYPYRPLICRLFGFSVSQNKYGQYAYGGCRIIKSTNPHETACVPHCLQKKIRLVTMANFVSRASSAGVGHDQTMLPINIALRRALEKVGFELEKHEWKCRI